MTAKNQVYIDKLEALGVLDQFKRNCDNDPDNGGFDEYCKVSEPTFKEFILRAFYWDKTPEGVEFWMEIAYKNK